MERIGLRTLVGIVFAVWFISFLLLYFLLPNWEVRGQAGDLFGAVNALFSGLAFAGLIFTVRLQSEQLGMQRQELALQREELRQQRQEMAGSRSELANQVRMQEALFRATVAQIRVASVNARIEASKLEGEAHLPHARQIFVGKITMHADELMRLADIVEMNDSA